jgi:hypothetical protein
MNLIRIFVACFAGTLAIASRAQDPGLLHRWNFDKTDGQRITEVISGVNDTIEGKYTPVAGVSGKAIRLDGFTCVVRHPAGKTLAGVNSATVEAWVALAAYPWNWCPVIEQFDEEVGGFSLMIGPRGEVGFKAIVSHNTVSVVTDQTLERNAWNHIAAVFENGKGITVYINEAEAGSYQTVLKPILNVDRELRIGMNYDAVYPSDRIGENGITPYWFSIDGIIDEVSVYGKALSGKEIQDLYRSKLPVAKPEIPVRHLPRVNSTGRFKAYYTKLSYYPEWDEQWPVSSDPDIVVSFKDSPVKLIFWRGSRYSPAWVTENHLWMADQSVETWNGPQGCLEHMQDRHCKYSHVRILEDNNARKVIHWRYAPVSAYNDLWVMNEKTGWEVWIDEYYIIYPDATAIRKYTWKTEYMGHPRQFQESVPFTEEDQLQGDVMEADYLQVANLKGDKQLFQYVEDPSASKNKPVPDNPNIQRHNLKSDFDPFIIFEPGNRMHYISDRDIRNLSSPGSCNHWPVGQAYCDGRRVYVPDRPTSFLGFPISDPVIHDGPDGRSWINSLYGMKNINIDQLVVLASSWANSPELKVTKGSGFKNKGYDMSEKMYRLKYEGSGHAGNLQCRINASGGSPVYNPAICIEGWGDGEPVVKINGMMQTDGKDYRYGFEERLEGTSLVVWLDEITEKSIEVVIFAK